MKRRAAFSTPPRTQGNIVIESGTARPSIEGRIAREYRALATLEDFVRMLTGVSRAGVARQKKETAIMDQARWMILTKHTSTCCEQVRSKVWIGNFMWG